jgi:predicted O-linked N-acetylglucosamine transferase (SPINDLY family)
MTDLIAHTPQQYVELALRLARDPQRLAELRPTLRQRMQRSPLLDHAAFAADVEAAYRSAWRAWVSAQPPEA